jgi:unsaturated chondroitin disaccharide hydrolase
MISLETLQTKALNAFEFAGHQLKHLVTTHPDKFPLYTDNGKWQIDGETWTNWCEGFLGGQLWLIFEHTGDSWFREQAEHYSLLIEPRKVDKSVHDLGFLFWSTWKHWYDLTGDMAQKQVLIQAGQTAGQRFVTSGNYLPSFLAKDSIFIDIMMNVGIIFFAALETQDDALLQIATNHCLTTRRFLVRGDGSTAHEGIFDITSGEFLYQSTQQGWRRDSSWARGQAWALYGFSTAYAFTGNRKFLQTAVACADYFIENTPTFIPPNDWRERAPKRPYESSAAAIAASGLLDLANHIHDQSQANVYRNFAFNVIDVLTTPHFLAFETPGWEGVLKHGSYHEEKGLGVNESVMWGDYFFLEALTKILNIGRMNNDT